MNRSRRLSVDLSAGVGSHIRRSSVDYGTGVDPFSRRSSVDFGNLGLPLSLPTTPSIELRSPTGPPSRRPSDDLNIGVGVTVSIVYWHYGFILLSNKLYSIDTGEPNIACHQDGRRYTCMLALVPVGRIFTF